MIIRGCGFSLLLNLPTHKIVFYIPSSTKLMVKLRWRLVTWLSRTTFKQHTCPCKVHPVPYFVTLKPTAHSCFQNLIKLVATIGSVNENIPAFQSAPPPPPLLATRQSHLTVKVNKLPVYRYRLTNTVGHSNSTYWVNEIRIRQESAGKSTVGIHCRRHVSDCHRSCKTFSE